MASQFKNNWHQHEGVFATLPNTEHFHSEHVKG